MTTWIFHHLFADSECVPSGEQRLTWVKKDDNGAAFPLRIFQEDDEGLKPYEKAYGLDPTDLRKDAQEILSDVERESARGGVRDYAIKFRNTIIREVLDKRRNAEELRKMIDGDIPSSEQAFRLKLEELLKPNKKSQGDDALRAAIEATRKEVKTDLQKDDPSWGTIFLDKIREKLQQLGPLYRRLASFLSNPEVQSRIALSPEQAFLALSNPAERLNLFQRLAAMRHDLVFQGSQNIAERRRALDDLFGFFYHGQDMLRDDERTIFYDTYMRVGACSAAINEYEARLKDKDDSQKTPEEELYRGKFQHVGRFLREDRESSSRTITGKKGLIARLESASTKEGEGKNAFGILAEGLREGGWIPEVPESLRYTCTLIALEELGYLYMRMASGSSTMPKDAASLTAHVKMLVLEALRRGTTGKKGEVPFDITYIDPRKDFDALEKKIRATATPAKEDVNELILLYSWLEHRGETPRMSLEELEQMRSRSEATDEALVNEVKRTQKLLPPEISLGSPEDLMRALEEILEEEKLYESAVWKERVREARTFHDETDTAYVEKLRMIRALPKSEKEKESLLTALDEAYDQGNLERQKIHALQLAERKTALLEALQAEIRLRARKIRQQFLEALKEHQAKIQNLEWIPFSHTLGSVEPLENLEHLDLLKSSSPLQEAEEALAELQAQSDILRDPLGDAVEEQSLLEAARKAARDLLENPIIKAASSQTKEYLRLCAEPDAPIGAKAIKALLFFQNYPEELLEGEKNFEEMQPNLKIHQPLEAGDHTEWNSEKEKVFSRIRNILPAYDPPTAYNLTEHFKVNGIEAKKLEYPVPEARQHLYRLQKLADVLERVNKSAPLELSEEDFAGQPGLSKNHFGAFLRKPEGKECIILNSSKLESVKIAEKLNETEISVLRKAVLLEERLHALNYALARYLGRSYFQNVYSIMEKAGGEAFQTLGQKWVKREPGMTNRDWQWEVTDEFLAKRRVFYDAYGRKEDAKGETSLWILRKPILTLTDEEIAFFKHLYERGVNPFPVADDVSWEEKASYRPAAAAGPGDEHDDPLDPFVTYGAADRDVHGNPVEREENIHQPQSPRRQETGAALADAREPSAGESQIPDDLRKSEQDLFNAKKFLETYPDHGTFSGENAAYVAQLEKEYVHLKEEFLHDSNAETNDSFRKRVHDLKEKFSMVLKEISRFDLMHEDLRSEPPKGKGLSAIWRDVQWVSFFDITRMFKDIVEDIKRQYNRRQEGKVGRIGESVTHWIPSWVPYLGNLHHEFHDRRQKAELDEVEHFKKSLDNVDSFELQMMTHHTKNKDHLKAIMMLLTERGRMNWNDVDMWNNLSSLSIYKIPVDECKRNENLREAWLRKVISEIWEDKDNYRAWKTKNDGAFEEKMKGYTTEVDRLSNLKGGLRGELIKQLRTYVQHKEGHLHGPMDEAVRPQLYNEILDYAIRNGKMTMEDKFFFLVQGLAHGLLSMDRLRILAGEKGGILNIFPFIDYFYGRNNTHPEIVALARRLRESDSWKDDSFYEPGLKTTLWLELEVAREDSVKQRLSKGMSKRGGDTDHDDMNFFIPRIDFRTISQLSTPQGGGRPQLSPEAWENAYSGYNSFFKSFGYLAKLEEEKIGERFTVQDAQQIVQAVSGFVRMDGILTNRATYDTRQSQLAWLRMKSNYSVVSDKTKTVYQERETIETFARDLLREFGYSTEDIENLLYSTELSGQNAERATKSKNLSEVLESTLLQRVTQPGGMEIMKRVLMKHANFFSSPIGKNYTYEKVKAIKEEEKRKPMHANSAATSSHH